VDDPQDFRIQPCLSPVVDTGDQSRGAAREWIDTHDPKIERAVAWLASQEVRTPGDWF